MYSLKSQTKESCPDGTTARGVLNFGHPNDVTFEKKKKKEIFFRASPEGRIGVSIYSGEGCHLGSIIGIPWSGSETGIFFLDLGRPQIHDTSCFCISASDSLPWMGTPPARPPVPDGESHRISKPLKALPNLLGMRRRDRAR
jgi:hypothetical protein